MRPLPGSLRSVLRRRGMLVESADPVQDDPRPAQASGASATRDERLRTAYLALRSAAFHLDSALAIGREQDVPFLMGDLPGLIEKVEMLGRALDGYRKNEKGEQG